MEKIIPLNKFKPIYTSKENYLFRKKDDNFYIVTSRQKEYLIQNEEAIKILEKEFEEEQCLNYSEK